MENTLQLLNGQQAAKWLNLNYRTFMKEVSKGNIGYKIIGSVRRYPLKALEEWLNNITFHLDYTNVAKSTTPISRSCPKQEKEYSLEKLLEEHRRAKQQNTALKELHKSNKKKGNKQPENIL